MIEVILRCQSISLKSNRGQLESKILKPVSKRTQQDFDGKQLICILKVTIHRTKNPWGKDKPFIIQGFGSF